MSISAKTKKFYLDCCCDPVEGYDLGGHWNGFAKPAFTKEVAVAILTQLNHTIDLKWKFDEEYRVFLTEDHDTAEVDVYIAHPYKLDDNSMVELYTIGYSNWCWIEEPEAEGE